MPLGYLCLVLHAHLPLLIFGLLICVTLLSGLLAGYAMAKRKPRKVKGLYHQRAELVSSMKKAAESTGNLKNA